MKRVRVWSGDGETYLGEGELVGEVTVYYWYKAGVAIESLLDAEQRPHDDLVALMAERGFVLIESDGNPKIVLDDGTVKYGCQVWWKYQDGEIE
jgi:hypothetical protein